MRATILAELKINARKEIKPSPDRDGSISREKEKGKG
jgi:hypothetical protein